MWKTMTQYKNKSIHSSKNIQKIQQPILKLAKSIQFREKVLKTKSVDMRRQRVPQSVQNLAKNKQLSKKLAQPLKIKKIAISKEEIYLYP